MDSDTDKHAPDREFSCITRLSIASADRKDELSATAQSQSQSVHTIVIRPSTTRLISKSESSVVDADSIHTLRYHDDDDDEDEEVMAPPLLRTSHAARTAPVYKPSPKQPPQAAPSMPRQRTHHNVTFEIASSVSCSRSESSHAHRSPSQRTRCSLSDDGHTHSLSPSSHHEFVIAAAMRPERSRISREGGGDSDDDEAGMEYVNYAQDEDDDERERKQSKAEEYEVRRRVERTIQSITVLSKSVSKTEFSVHHKNGKKRISGGDKHSKAVDKKPKTKPKTSSNSKPRKSKTQTTAGKKKRSNEYKHLEQKMIDNHYKAQARRHTHTHNHNQTHSKSKSRIHAFELQRETKKQTQKHQKTRTVMPVVHALRLNQSHSLPHQPPPAHHAHAASTYRTAHQSHSPPPPPDSPISDVSLTQSQSQSRSQSRSGSPVRHQGTPMPMHPPNINIHNSSGGGTGGSAVPPPFVRRVQSQHTHYHHNPAHYAQPHVQQPYYDYYDMAAASQSHLPPQSTVMGAHPYSVYSLQQPPHPMIHRQLSQPILHYPPPQQPQLQSWATANIYAPQPTFMQAPRAHRSMTQPQPQQPATITTFHPQQKNASSESSSSSSLHHQLVPTDSQMSGGSADASSSGPPVKYHRNHVTFYAYDHDNGTMIALEAPPPMLARKLEDQLSSKCSSYISNSPHATNTPLSATNTPTKTPTKTASAATTATQLTTTTTGTDTDADAQSAHSSHSFSSLIHVKKLNSHEMQQYGENKCLLLEYAVHHFQVRKHLKRKLSASIFSKDSYHHSHQNAATDTIDMNVVNELIKFAPFKKLKHSLLKMESREMDKLGLQVWKTINSYIGTRKSSKSRAQQLDRLLQIAFHVSSGNNGDGDEPHWSKNIGDSQQLIRDEIFCQIVKQTNDDDDTGANSAFSYDSEPENVHNLAWKLLCICCSVFAPSAKLSKYVASYLYEKMRENEDNEYAKFALTALHETMAHRSRVFAPSQLELTQIANRQPIKIEIYFLDNSHKSVLISSQTTVKQVLVLLAKQMKINFKHLPDSHNRTSSCFGLYEMEDVATRKRYEDEVKFYNLRLDMNYKQKLHHLLHFMPCDEELSENDRVLDVLASWNKLEHKLHRNLKLVFKLKIVQRHKMDRDLYHRNEWKLIYMSAVWNVLFSQFPMNSEKLDVFSLVALHLQQKYGVHCNVSHMADIAKYIPYHLLQKYSLEQCKQAIASKLKIHSRLQSKEECWKLYVRYLQQQQHAPLELHRLIGCTFFRCIKKCKPTTANAMDSEDVIVGVNEHSILMIHPLTKQIVHSYKLEEILTYGFKSNSFIIVAGRKQQPQKYQFGTLQGKQMNDLLQRYIDIKASLSSI